MNTLINKGWLKDIINQQCDLIEEWLDEINDVREYLTNTLIYGNVVVDQDSIMVCSGQTTLVTAMYHNGIYDSIMITKGNLLIRTNGTSVICSNDGKIVYEDCNKQVVHGLVSIANAFVLANEINKN